MSEYMLEGILRSADELLAIAIYRGKRLAELAKYATGLSKRSVELEAILRQIGSEELRFTNRGYHIARDYFAAQENDDG
jgi:hypothetical protein